MRDPPIMPVKPMPKDIERKLVTRARAGDQEAMNTLFAQWNPWINARVRFWLRKSHRWITRDDLLSAGMVGLWRGIRKWRQKDGARLGTYATHWIDHEIRRAMSQRLIHIPQNELGKHRDITDRVFSMDSRSLYWLRGGADIRPQDPAEIAIENLTREEMRRTINRVSGRMLTKRQAQILRMHAVEDMTPVEISQKLGISKARVRFVIDRAKETLGSSDALRRMVEHLPFSS